MDAYSEQVGNSLPYFYSPVNYQRGRGFGSILRSLFRAVQPIFKKPIVRRGLKALGKAAGNVALDTAHTALLSESPNLSQSLKRSVKREAQKLITNDGPPYQRLKGGGLIAKLPSRKRKRVSRKLTVVRKRRVIKKRSRDIFG